jgi:tRNA threonylcarbamoyladenosine biosynthesis protein TsaB
MILALKTSGPSTYAALYKSDDSAATPLGELKWESGRALADELLGRLEALLHSAGAQWVDLTGIVIFSGPGSFTSLRIGHSVANSLADSLTLPIAGATGEEWIGRGMESLSQAQPGRPALPDYGAEPNITHPAGPTPT